MIKVLATVTCCGQLKGEWLNPLVWEGGEATRVIVNKASRELKEKKVFEASHGVGIAAGVRGMDWNVDLKPRASELVRGSKKEV